MPYLVRAAERLYGSRVKDWKFNRISFSDDVNRIRYLSESEVNIELNFLGLYRIENAYFQLAHECVHFLSPVFGRSEVSVLEEGLAVHFSHYILRRDFGLDWSMSTERNPNYQLALEQIAPLLEREGAIKQLRNEQPVISKINAELILKHFPYLGQLAETVTQPFTYV